MAAFNSILQFLCKIYRSLLNACKSVCKMMDMNGTDMELETKHLTVAAAAKELGVPYPTLIVWVREGRARAKKFKRKSMATYRIAAVEIERLRKRLAAGLPV